jgi:plastocyanin
MMKRSFGLIINSVYFLFSIALMNSCSNPSNRNGTGNETKSNIPKVETSLTDPGAQHVYTISISDMKFYPEKVVVHKGDTVKWINHDIVAHCVTELPDKVWTSSEIPAEGSWKMAVTQSSGYYCSIHPVMKGKIVMKLCEGNASVVSSARLYKERFVRKR